MDSSSVACDFFLRIKHSWKCRVIDVAGLSGGLLLAWDPSYADLRSFVTVVRMMVEGNIKGFKSSIRIRNVYGPYSHRQDFWENVERVVLLQDNSLILAGDFNLTLSTN